jgi:putative secretion ATPase (PEP-CTERM system associated)
LLTGEVGSGKTTLIRNLLGKHYEHVVLSKIFNTCVTSEQMLAMINDDFGMDTDGKDKVALIRDLNTFLVEQYARGNQPILIIDEAQNLSSQLLEEVRMLSNLETSDCKLLQIILVGQPELRATLSAPELRQLRQRISINCHLQALNREEVGHYINHRLEVAGNATAVEFSTEAMETVFRYSKGIPRLINIICDFLMLSAFAEETTIISGEMVRDVIGDLDFDNYYWSVDPASVNKGLPTAVSGSLPDSTLQNQQMFSLLSDISRRIESLESSSLGTVQDGLKELNEGFMAFQNSISNHLTKNDAQILSLKNRLEALMQPVESNQQTAPIDPPRSGFVRRLFGGDTVSRQNGKVSS